ncbi:MAG: hypothetical protein Rsou_0452 [Candidatus Ruthia sp. Asou_11_S2]|nr:hypothetical protein [Candidatus Ruthia sp. Asou_11_S2]
MHNEPMNTLIAVGKIVIFGVEFDDHQLLPFFQMAFLI